jgi:hypothetical protein
LTQVYSPVDIQIVAPDGKWAGKNISNLPDDNKIVGAYYTGFDIDSEFVSIPNPDGKYRIVTQGMGNGSYTVETTVVSQDGGIGEVKETKNTVQGETVLGQEKQIELEVKSGRIVDDADVVAPVVQISSPENNKTYLNNIVLPINYQASDNKTGADKIKTEVYLDGATSTLPSIDLAYEKTGNHILKIIAQDEADNIGQGESLFIVSASVDSIIANLGRYVNSGEMKGMEKIVLASQMKLLESQFYFLDQIKNNSKFSAGAKKIAIGELKLAINKQIDIVINEINEAPKKLIDANIVVLLVDSLMYIKIK